MKLSSLISKRAALISKIVFISLLLITLAYEIFWADHFSFDDYNCESTSNLLLVYSENHKNNNKKPEHKIKACQNDLYAQNEIAIWTLLTDDTLKYTIGAVKLLKSIQSNVKTTKFDAIILELIERPLEKRVKDRLLIAGWKICRVERIAPSVTDEEYIIQRFRDQFTKLILWSIDEYAANYYFDADTLVIRNIDSFLHMYHKLDSKRACKLGCTQDYRGKWVDAFNMGVFFVKPDKKEFTRLLSIKDDSTFKYEVGMAEQGFLNEVYKNQWFDIGFVNNANLAVYNYVRDYWVEREYEINVIHFTTSKPWYCKWNVRELCSKWHLINHC